MKTHRTPNSRKVNRTVELLQITATCVNLDDMTIVTKEVAIPSIGYRTEDAKEKAIKSACSAIGNFKLVDFKENGSIFQTYTMQESFFLAHAELTAEGDNIKNMHKLSNSTENNTNEEENN